MSKRILSDRDRIIKIRNGMIERCYNKKSQAYHYYGGRGIKICDEWLNSRDAFYEWAISHGYQKGLTIDRINNDGDYTPENCRWVDYYVQANNKSTNTRYEYKGESLTLRQICDKYGYEYELIRSRIQSEKWSLEDAINRAKREIHNVEINGVVKPLQSWAKEYGVARNTAYNRFHKGLPISEVLNPNKLPKDGITKQVNLEEYNKNRIEYKGEFYTLKELARKFNLSSPCLSYRLKDMGMSIEEAVSYQSRKHFMVTIGNETKTLSEWCKEKGIRSDVVRNRLKRGLSVEEAFDNTLTTKNGRTIRNMIEDKENKTDNSFKFATSFKKVTDDK